MGVAGLHTKSSYPLIIQENLENPKNRGIMGTTVNGRPLLYHSLDKIKVKIDSLKKSSTEEADLALRAILRALGGTE